MQIDQHTRQAAGRDHTMCRMRLATSLSLVHALLGSACAIAASHVIQVQPGKR